MQRFLIIVFIATILPGCVGLAAGTYGTKEWARTDFSLENSRNEFSFQRKKSNYSISEVVDLWGKPDTTETYEQCQVLIYEKGTSWAGVGAFVGVVPVPLAVPTGTYKNRLYFFNGSTVGIVQEYGEVDRAVGYTCGSNACDASAGERINEPEINAKDAVKQWCHASL